MFEQASRPSSSSAGAARELPLDVRIQRGHHVAGHAGDDDAGTAGLDHPAEFVDAQCDTQQVDGQHRLGGRLLRREPRGVHDRGDPSGCLGRLGDRGHRTTGGDVDFAGQHVMPVFGERTRRRIPGPRR